MRLKVTTCNTKPGIDTEIEWYNETHMVESLCNMDHVISTIDSIIKNNIIYWCEDTILEKIHIMCDDQDTVEYITNYWDIIFRYPNIKVCIDFEIL